MLDEIRDQTGKMKSQQLTLNSKPTSCNGSRDILCVGIPEPLSQLETASGPCRSIRQDQDQIMDGMLMMLMLALKAELLP